jgi:zeta-carotene desaturase
VAVIGGGLAGMSASIALAGAGYRITLMEKRPSLGGRAGSQLDVATGEWIDNCQHVLMACCTNLLDFYRRIKVENRIRFYPEIPFLDLRGRISCLRSSRLPAPLHCLPSFLALKFLSPGQKARIAGGLASLWQLRRDRSLQTGLAADWLLRRWQTEATILSFWQPILVSALNDEVHRASASYAAKFFIGAFLANSRGWWLGIPTVPLSALYGENVTGLLKGNGSECLLRSPVQHLAFHEGKVSEAVTAGGHGIAADRFVLAVPWHAARDLMPAEAAPRLPLPHYEDLEPSPITGVHVWFDRPVTSLDFAVLPGRRIQWFFNKTRTFEGQETGECYLQLVTSASRSWLDLGKSEILEIALQDLHQALPVSRSAIVLKARVVKEPMATFSPNPASERLRPSTATGIPNLFLAGDWIQTGWPSTMEGAVRAGYIAASAVLAADGRTESFLLPDLSPSGLMRLWRAPA